LLLVEDKELHFPDAVSRDAVKLHWRTKIESRATPTLVEPYHSRAWCGRF